VGFAEDRAMIKVLNSIWLHDVYCNEEKMNALQHAIKALEDRSRGTEICSFFAPGIPRPKGNMIGMEMGKGRNRKIITIEKPVHAKKLKPWTESIRRAAAPHMPSTPLLGPVEVGVVFYFPKPGNPKNGNLPVGSEADVDKLLRALGDAGQETWEKIKKHGVVVGKRLVFRGIWKDDKQVVTWLDPQKRFGEPGAQITVRALEPEPEQLKLEVESGRAPARRTRRTVQGRKGDPY